MEQPNGIDQRTSELPIGALTILLGIVTTFNVVINVLLRWKSYDWLGKSLSVVLVANLVLLLVHFLMERKGRRKLQPDRLLQILYGCLLLATFAFNRH